jgi:hypothetical protein
VYVALVQLGLITTCAVFNPVFATYRLEETPNDRVARTLAAWNTTTKMSVAVLTGVWGVLATFAGLRIAIGVAGAIVLATPLLLPKRRHLEASAHDAAVHPHAMAAAHERLDVTSRGGRRNMELALQVLAADRSDTSQQHERATATNRR